MNPGRAQAQFGKQEGLRQRMKVSLQACCPVRRGLPLHSFPGRQGLQRTAESSCAPRGSGSASGDNEVASPGRDASAAAGLWLPARALGAFR